MSDPAGLRSQANAGDSRAVASVSGRAEPLSVDHKPQDQLEQERITAAGGWVVFNRVNGNLALSRALGDFPFKQNSAVTAERQVVTGGSPGEGERGVPADRGCRGGDGGCPPTEAAGGGGERGVPADRACRGGGGARGDGHDGESHILFRR